VQLGLEAQVVVALRLMRLAAGGAAGLAETPLMIADKMFAMRECQVAVLGWPATAIAFPRT